MRIGHTSVSTVQLGDKGDGTRAGRDAAARRYDHLCSTHIPDIVVGSALWEFKAISPFKPKPALGMPNNAGSGTPSCADGHLIAFGNTLEAITRQTRGLDGIGSESEPAFDRTTGVGFVAPYAGDYRGRAPHVPLTLVHSETTGALSPESLKSIAHLDKLANKPAHRDGTQYGSRRGATRSFRRQHTSEIYSAIVYADAETLLAHAEGAPV